MADRPPDSPRVLARTMACATGLDLALAQRTGWLSADDVSDLVQSCRRCTAWADCPSWMTAQDGDEAQAPGYCRNRAFFDAMRRRRIDEATG